MRPEDVESQLVGEPLEAPSGEVIGVFESARFDAGGGLHAWVNASGYQDFSLDIEPSMTSAMLDRFDSIDDFTGSLGTVVASLVNHQPGSTRYEISLQTPPGEETGPYGDPDKKPPASTG